MQEVTPQVSPWRFYVKTWIVSIGVMFVSSAASTAGLFSLEGVPAALSVNAFLTPAPILFLAADRKWANAAKHAIYHLYWIPAALLYLGTYFTSSEVPLMGPVVAFFITVPALCGYAVLFLCERRRR